MSTLNELHAAYAQELNALTKPPRTAQHYVETAHKVRGRANWVYSQLVDIHFQALMYETSKINQSPRELK